MRPQKDHNRLLSKLLIGGGAVFLASLFLHERAPAFGTKPALAAPPAETGDLCPLPAKAQNPNPQLFVGCGGFLE